MQLAVAHDDPPRAELRLPELDGKPPFRLRARLRSHTPNGPQKISLSLNGVPLESVDVPVEWEEFTRDLPPQSVRPAVNFLTFGFEKQSRPFLDYATVKTSCSWFQF